MNLSRLLPSGRYFLLGTPCHNRQLYDFYHELLPGFLFRLKVLQRKKSKVLKLSGGHSQLTLLV